MKKRVITGILSAILFAGITILTLHYYDELEGHETFLSVHLSGVFIMGILFIPIASILGVIFSEIKINRVRKVKILSIIFAYFFNIISEVFCAMGIMRAYSVSHSYELEIWPYYVASVIIIGSFTYLGYYLGAGDEKV